MSSPGCVCVAATSVTLRLGSSWTVAAGAAGLAGCSVPDQPALERGHCASIWYSSGHSTENRMHAHGAQDIITAAGGEGSVGPLTVASVPTSAGGGASAEATLQHFMFHAPPRRQFLMPLLSAEPSERSRNQVRTLTVRSMQHPIHMLSDSTAATCTGLRHRSTRVGFLWQASIAAAPGSDLRLLRSASQGCGQNFV